MKSPTYLRVEISSDKAEIWVAYTSTLGTDLAEFSIQLSELQEIVKDKKSTLNVQKGLEEIFDDWTNSWNSGSFKTFLTTSINADDLNFYE